MPRRSGGSSPRASGSLARAVAVGAALAFVCLGTTHPASAAACKRIELRPRLGWVTTGAWLASGKTLAVVDDMNNSVVKVSEDGTPLGVVTGPSGELVGDLHLNPVGLQPQDGGGVVMLGQFRGENTEHLITFDGSFAPRHSMQASMISRASLVDRKSAGVTVYGNFSWLPVGADEVVSFADFTLGPRRSDWASGFIRYSLSKPESLTILTRGNLEEPERLFNRLGYQYIATIGDKAYILDMGSSTTLYESSKGRAGLRRLEEYPSRLTPNDLGNFKEWKDFPGVMHQVERSTMPAGLYAWQNFLYVLGRSPDRQGTRWTLTRVSPETGKELGIVTLPTKADHLVIVPGPRKIAILEKGPISADIRQTTNTMILVPTSKFQGEFSGNLCN